MNDNVVHMFAGRNEQARKDWRDGLVDTLHVQAGQASSLIPILTQAVDVLNEKAAGELGVVGLDMAVAVINDGRTFVLDLFDWYNEFTVDELGWIRVDRSPAKRQRKLAENFQPFFRITKTDCTNAEWLALPFVHPPYLEYMDELVEINHRVSRLEENMLVSPFSLLTLIIPSIVATSDQLRQLNPVVIGEVNGEPYWEISIAVGMARYTLTCWPQVLQRHFANFKKAAGAPTEPGQ